MKNSVHHTLSAYTMLSRTTMLGALLVVSLFAKPINVLAENCTNSPCCGDIDNSGTTDIQDLSEYFGYFFLGTSFSTENADIDDYSGLTIRDALFFAAHNGTDFRPLSCPPANTSYVLNDNSDFIFRHRTLAPVNTTSFQIPVYTDFARSVTAYALPIRVLVGNDTATITAVARPNQPSSEPLNGNPRERLITDINPFPSSPIVSAGLLSFGTVSVSVPASSSPRLIRIETLKSSWNVTPQDTNLVASVYEEQEVENPASLGVGWTPEIRNYLCGDVTGDGSIDIGDLTELVDHLFINFPPLSVTEAGNVDSQEGIDIADLTLLVAHLFSQTPLTRC